MMVQGGHPLFDRSLLPARGEHWASSEQVLEWGRELLSGQWRVVARKSSEGRLALLLGKRTRTLTLGEQQVLSAYVEGFSSKRIALELGLARSTVSQRLASATVALGFQSRAELLFCAAHALNVPPSAKVQDAAVKAKALDQPGERVLLFCFEIAGAPLPAVLTPAEREVVHEVLAGKSNAAIAAARGASRHTVANQLAKIYRKLRVGSRWELMSRCPSMTLRPSLA
jgi:DNA-binding NarL/FixJ family response regulator